jgi:hypothetical protein
VPCWDLMPRSCKDNHQVCSECEVYLNKMNHVLAARAQGTSRS